MHVMGPRAVVSVSLTVMPAKVKAPALVTAAVGPPTETE